MVMAILYELFRACSFTPLNYLWFGEPTSRNKGTQGSHFWNTGLQNLYSFHFSCSSHVGDLSTSCVSPSTMTVPDPTPDPRLVPFLDVTKARAAL